MLYCYQGFLLGLNEAIKLLLKEKGSSDAALSLQALTTSPYYFKFIIAPFMDVYYSRYLGKRMSWILPISVIASAMFFLFANKVEVWIDQQAHQELALYIFIQFVFIAFQDVAIDSMVCEILNEEDYEKGSLMQTLGQTVGPFLCCNMFILLISEKFGSETLGLKGSLITVHGFLIFMGFFVLATTVGVLVVVDERKIANTSVNDKGIQELDESTEPSISELLKKDHF